MSKGACLLTHILLSKTGIVKDPMSSYFMLRRSPIEGISLNLIGYKVLLELLVKGRYNLVVEISYVFRPRARGKSRLTYKQFLNYLLRLFTYFCLTYQDLSS